MFLVPYGICNARQYAFGTVVQINFQNKLSITVFNFKLTMGCAKEERERERGKKSKKIQDVERERERGRRVRRFKMSLKFEKDREMV